ncbi:MAG: response regulator, partial [Nitrospiraceae bacterium]
MNQVPSFASFGPDHAAHQQQPVNVLLVDDSPESLTAMEALLSGPDRNLVKVASGQEALRYLLTHDVGLILLDVKMAGMSGYETAALIRKRERTRNIPIIFLTAYSKDDDDITRGYSYGAAGYEFKPIVPATLQSKVSCFVELAKQADGLRSQKEDLERVEAELMRAKATAAVVKYAPAPVFIADGTGTILQVNDAAEELLALKLEETVERSVSRMLSANDTWQVAAALREVVERGVMREVSFRVMRGDGEALPIVLRVSPLRDDVERVIGVMGLLCDMRAYEQVIADLERTKAELDGKNLDLEAFRDIVVARD